MITLESCFISVNHAGFRGNDPMKRALLLHASPADRLFDGVWFEAVRASDFIRYPLRSPECGAAVTRFSAPIQDTPFGATAICDLSALEARGGYFLQAGGARSRPFLIYDDVWRRAFRILLEWYRVASCGEAVPGYHERCHQADATTPDGRRLDLAGGWHDAGDLRKWTSTMGRISRDLAEFALEFDGRWEATGVDSDLVLAQLRRAADYLAKTVDPDVQWPFHRVASAPDNSDNVWGESPMRRVDPTPSPHGATRHVPAMALLSLALRRNDPERARAALASALRVWSATAARLTPIEQIPCALALWRATGEDRYGAVARAGLDALLDRQTDAPAFGQDRLRGYFTEPDGRLADNGDFRGRRGRNLFTFVRWGGWLAQAILYWPNDAGAPRRREGLIRLLEGCIEPLLERNPFGVLPTCLFARHETTLRGRELAGDLVWRLFPRTGEGHNAWLANAADDLVLASRALGESKWRHWAQRQLDWIAGFNPLDESMITGLGYRRFPVFSFYVGDIPGGVINGFTGDEDDRPVLSAGREMAPMNMEYWSVNTGAFLRALARIEADR